MIFIAKQFARGEIGSFSFASPQDLLKIAMDTLYGAMGFLVQLTSVFVTACQHRRT